MDGLLLAVLWGFMSDDKSGLCNSNISLEFWGNCLVVLA